MAVRQSAPAPVRSSARRPGRLWSRLHFLIRFVGLTGALAACVGLVLAGLDGLLVSWPAARDAAVTALHGGPAAVGTYLVLGGAGAALFALLVEALVILRFTAGRRSIFGLNAVLQVGLATVLLVGVNLWSFHHSWRADWTRGQQFTLPAPVLDQLGRLRDETTVLVYERHKTFGALTDKPDRFDYAAERKVVEKVKDLVAQLREAGPRFRVEVLDVEQEHYDENLRHLTEGAPALRQAIESAPENSIFFFSHGRVQQMSFNDFYRLDKTASREEDNLVLRYAGVAPVVNRILNLEERRPRIGILVFHEALSTEGTLDLYTLAGARKALEAQGFEVRDVITRREENGELVPAVDALEDTRLDRLRDELDALNDELRDQDQEIEDLSRLVKALPREPVEKLNQEVIEYARRNGLLLVPRVTERNREVLRRYFDDQRAALGETRQRTREERDQAARELASLDADRIGERRRLTDLHAKLGRILADCDLLIVPRLTILPQGLPISSPRLHDLNAEQAAAIKDFLRTGKPVLACFGPVNMPNRPLHGPDELERLLGELGIHFGKRTVIFNAETRAFAERRNSPFRASKPLRLPPLRLEVSSKGAVESTGDGAAALKEPGAVLGAAAAGPLALLPFVQPLPSRAPNPVRESLRLTDREVGRGLELTARFPRPVYLDPLRARRLPYSAELLATSPEAWTDDQPFSTPTRPVPRFEAPAADDPDNGTPEARRRGAFTVGLALEEEVPRDWSEPDENRRRVRVAAIGHGGLFTGRELEPAREKLLVDTCNWLLGRDDRLAHDSPEWCYPRVGLSEQAQAIWLWGARLGLPVLFAYLGLVVLLVRRLR